MKKTVVLKALLIVFPILAVGLATTVNSVTVFNTLTGVIEYYSYFDILPVSGVQMVTPLAASMSVVSGILAAIYMATKKRGFCKAAGYTAIASACLASVPVLVRAEIMVLPNVALPIFMMLEFIVAYMIEKQETEKVKQAEPIRLKQKKRK